MPYSAVVRLADGIPNAEFSLLQGEGHFWISRRYAEVYGWLADGRGPDEPDRAAA